MPQIRININIESTGNKTSSCAVDKEFISCCHSCVQAGVHSLHISILRSHAQIIDIHSQVPLGIFYFLFFLNESSLLI